VLQDPAARSSCCQQLPSFSSYAPLASFSCRPVWA
jgi:hypothetical protein